MRIPVEQQPVFILQGWLPGRPAPSEDSRKKMSAAAQARSHGELSKTPANRRARQYKCRYKRTIQDFDNKFIEQGNRCALCPATGNAKRRLCWDHDHNCCSGYLTCGKCVRGLLCIGCNKKMGYFEGFLATVVGPKFAESSWEFHALAYLASYKDLENSLTL